MRYLDILDCSIADGEKIRVSLYVSGCSHKCKGCHNKESWDCDNGKLFNVETMDKLLNLLNRDYIDGLTLTGGDPLFEGNRDCILKIVKEVKEKLPNKTIWLYTGYEYDEIKHLEILNYIDVLVDGPYIEEQRDITLPFRGSKNQNIIYIKG
jgi:anaerobic ribonucleoside-triphosphate reductase activating protein